MKIAFPVSVILNSVYFRLLLAGLLGAMIGIERGRDGQAAGMRTHILVALGASLATLAGIYTVEVLGADSDPLRLSAQVISGIGFLGVGTILIRDRYHVTGLTTAAGLWATASVGIAVGLGAYPIALAAALLIWLVNTVVALPQKRSERRSRNVRIYVELNDVNRVNDFIDRTRGQLREDRIMILPARSGVAGNVGLEAELIPGSQIDRESFRTSLLREDYISYVL